jgi:hypothetical protein
MEWNLIDGDPPIGDFESEGGAQHGLDYRVEVAFHELEIVAYVGDLKIVGTAHFGHSGRATSQRSSDYLRRFTDKKLTLSDVRIFRHGGEELIDTVPFIVLNLDRVDLVYAREIGEEGRPPAAGSTGAQTPPGAPGA